MSSRWHPWKHAGDIFPDWRIHWHHELPDTTWGLTSFRDQRIWLCRRLDQVKRRCTLTHELIHLERGVPPEDPAGLAREEQIVDRLAAQRLITLPHLIDAYRACPSGDRYMLADSLWVDVPTLHTRMSTLDPIETAELEHALADEWLWIP